MVAMQLDFQIMPADKNLMDRFAGQQPAGGRLRTPLPLTIRLHARMEPLEADWRRLEREDNLSLHQSYDWCRAWAATHRAELLIVEGLSADRTEMILPLEIIRSGPLRIISSGRIISVRSPDSPSTIRSSVRCVAAQARHQS